MRYLVLATDYDGTLARDGRVDAPTMASLEAVRRSGRKIVLVTGRLLEDLAIAFPPLDLFEYVVAENGAVIHRPATHETRALAEPPPERFVGALRQRGVAPLGVGHVIVATWHPFEDVVLDAIRACGLELQVVFNKGAVMVLPAGINKAVGLAAALAEMKLSPHDVVGIGDAENDHAFLAACECRVAVANALPSLKERADWVTAGDHGAGVQELVRLLVAEDLRGVATTAEHTALSIGARADGAAAGELGADESFYFRGPADRLNLRARNLRTFTEIAEGVDDDTWEHHRRRHDYSRWFRDAIKDDELAAEVEVIEDDAAMPSGSSRDRIRAAIDRRYTAPA